MFLELNFHSRELGRQVRANVIIPEQFRDTNESYKTLWLLHGLTDDHSAWMRNSSIERYANDFGIAVVMPNVDRSWYTNTAYDANYFNYVAKELPEVCRKLFKGMSEKREDNIVGGLSMGGYGAVKLALSCPEQYGACISLSGSFDVTRVGRNYNLNEWRSIFGFDIDKALELAGSEHDLFALAERNKKEGRAFPKLYLWCGTEDFLVDMNYLFDKHLSSLDVPHVLKVSEGNHSWKWWDLHIQNALKYVLSEE